MRFGSLLAFLILWGGSLSLWGQSGELINNLRLVDMDRHEVLDLLEQYTGKEILRQQNLSQVKLNFKSIRPLTKEEAIRVIENLLSMNGIMVTKIDDRFMKAANALDGPKQIPILIQGTSLSYPPSQKIFMKFFKLEYLTSEEAMQYIQPLVTIGEPQQFPKTNSILVTDALLNIQRIETLLQDLDRVGTPIHKMSFIKLKNATAGDIVSSLKTFQQGSLRSQLMSSTFEADERTNKLIVFTHAENMPLIEHLVAELDDEVAPITKTEIFSLKHADAKDIHALIEEIITGESEKRDDGGRGPKLDNSRTNPRLNKGSSNDAQNNNANNTPRAASAAAGPAGESGEKTFQFSSFLTIVADERANTIVASGTKQDIANLAELISKLDSVLPQVRVEVVIVEVTLSKDQSRGIDSFEGTYNQSSSNEVTFGVNPSSSSRLDAPFTLSGTAKELSLISVIDIARKDSSIEIISTPTITTTHNTEGEIEVGEARPIITGSVTDSLGTTATRSQVQYQNISIKLKVKPKVGADGTISMEIEQQVQSITGFVDVDGNQQPIIGERVATSTVNVNDGELIILGGLQAHNSNDNDGRLAFIGRVPVIGSILASKSKESTKQDLIIFIKPKILDTSEKVKLDSDQARERLNYGGKLNSFIEGGDLSPQEPKIRKGPIGWYLNNTSPMLESEKEAIKEAKAKEKAAKGAEKARIKKLREEKNANLKPFSESSKSSNVEPVKTTENASGYYQWGSEKTETSGGNSSGAVIDVAVPQVNVLSEKADLNGDATSTPAFKLKAQDGNSQNWQPVGEGNTSSSMENTSNAVETSGSTESDKPQEKPKKKRLLKWRWSE